MKRKIRISAILMTALLLLLALSACSKKEEGNSGIPLEQSAESNSVTVKTPKNFVVDIEQEGRLIDISPLDYSYTISIDEELFEDMSSETFEEILEYHKSESTMIDNPYGDIAGRPTAVFLDDAESTDAVMVFVDLTGKTEGVDYLWIEIFPSDDSSPEEIYKKEEVMAILQSIKIK
ncbi:MAG: hypothetical protein Q4A78_02765 [Peptostreptococcaceae bacterium]|nr:hypothetical protein [Peptostreptococcaceae bacterium]